MDYENKYNEALEKARTINSGKYVDIPTEETVLEYIFPELVESEDEKIRKALVDFFNRGAENGAQTNGVCDKDIIAWLEKQKTSEEAIQYLKENHSPSEMSDFQTAMNIAVAKAYDKGMKDGLEKQGEKPQGKSALELWKDMRFEAGAQASGNRHEPPMSDNDSKLFSLNDIDEIMKIITEKQGEQKPVVEMKFPEESLGISPEEYNKIVDACLYDDKVEPKFHEGDWVVIPTSDGRNIVQVVSIEYFPGGQPRYITSKGTWFGNGTEARLWDISEAKDGDVLCVKYGNDELPFIFTGKQDDVAYCALNSFGEFVLSIAEWLLKTSVLPATQEQRDLLFQKMKEAGYTFDFEKKELKEIEQPKLTEFEDEKMFMSLHNLIYVVQDCDCDSMRKKELSDWLESLKDRVQPKQKQEWGKDDEKCIRLSTDIIDSALRAGFCVQSDRDRCADWLKSLKPQNKWKPSDEQMKVLMSEVEGWTKGCPKQKVLESLYNDLKKLK